ncbi:MAG: RloB family protein [Oscillospiraceae bacterium]|nr:RloB family protein [Oscillospiraceae bacterium]
MVNKPVKKSDLGKAWLRPRRDREITILPEYHLIVSEGTKTEPNYFLGLKREISRCGKNRIDIRIEGEGANTLSLLERAQAHVSSSNNPIKHVWLVYDFDDFPSDNFDNTLHKCIELSKPEDNVKYHALWSNQCIELWFMLHFEYFQSNVHRADYIPILDRFLTEISKDKYTKNRNDIYDILNPFLPRAIENAKRLKTLHNDDAPSRNAPGTNVYEIFEFLSVYIKIGQS